MQINSHLEAVASIKEFSHYMDRGSFLDKDIALDRLERLRALNLSFSSADKHRFNELVISMVKKLEEDTLPINHFKRPFFERALEECKKIVDRYKNELHKENL
jgi:hypothetical protein